MLVCLNIRLVQNVGRDCGKLVELQNWVLLECKTAHSGMATTMLTPGCSGATVCHCSTRCVENVGS